MVAALSSDAPPQIPARFEILGVLGEGARGRVHRVRDKTSGLERALKTVHVTNIESVLEFKAEFRRVAHLSHPHLAAVHELFVDSGVCCFTMDLVEGPTLDEWVKHLPEDERLERLTKILPGLIGGIARLHSSGIVHGDIKPRNVVMREGDWPVLVDFGLSEAPAFNPTIINQQMVGTWQYMAPEAAQGALGPAADWYSLAVVLYELICGRLPFQGVDALVAKDLGEFERLTSLGICDRTLAEAIDGLLEPEARRRPGFNTLLEAVPEAEELDRTTPADGTPAFVGRLSERTKLEQLIVAPRVESAVLAEVVGSSGIGKTSLLDEVISTVSRKHPGLVVLRATSGRGVSAGHPTLDPIVDQLREHLRNKSVPLAELHPAGCSALCQMFPTLEDTLEPDPEVTFDPRTAREAAARTLARLLELVRADRPLVILVDDAQWGDADSSSLLRSVLESDPPPNVTLIIGRRVDESGHLVETLQDWARSTRSVHHEVFQLAPFDETELEELAGTFHRTFSGPIFIA